MKRAQALVEFALILPIFLMLALGGVTVGLLILDRYELQHAASEGAIAGAEQPGQGGGIGLRTLRCRNAIAAAVAILGRRPAETDCMVRGRLVEVHLAETLPLLVPFVGDSWRVSVIARAQAR